MGGNVFVKLNTARMMMQNAHIKQNGKNKFAGWEYFELADILPAANRICSEIGATIYTQFDKDMAHLFFVDNESLEKIEFTLPMSTAELKGCHEVQNLGAVQTYLKRYLYQNCFEISEKDALDYSVDTTPDEDIPQETPKAKHQKQLAGGDTTPDERKKLIALFQAKKPDGSDVFTKEEVRAFQASRTEKTAAILIGELEKEVKSRTSFNDDKIPF